MAATAPGLLRCTLSPPPLRFPLPHSPLIEPFLTSIERGDYAAALSSAAVHAVFDFAESWNSADSAALFYDEVEKRVESFLHGDPAEAECRLALILCIGVAALIAFAQQIITGPIGDFSVFPLRLEKAGGGELDIWARRLLES